MAWSPPLASVPPQPHCSVAPSSWEQGTPSSRLEKGAGRLALGGGTTGPRPEHGRAGRSSGNVGPEVRCLGGLPAAAANVSTLGGRATHGGKEGNRAEWGKGEPSHCTAPSPGEWRIGETVTLSPSSVLPPPWGVGRSRCHQYFNF